MTKKADRQAAWRRLRQVEINWHEVRPTYGTSEYYEFITNNGDLYEAESDFSFDLMSTIDEMDRPNHWGRVV